METCKVGVKFFFGNDRSQTITLVNVDKNNARSELMRLLKAAHEPSMVSGILDDLFDETVVY